MATFIINPGRHYLRPTTAYGLDWENPLTRGLTHLWPLVSQYGYLDLVTQQMATLNAGGSGFEWAGHPVLGHSHHLPSGGSTNSMINTGFAALTAPWTVNYWWHRIDNTTGVAVMTSDTAAATGIRAEQFNNTNAVGFTYGGTDGSFGVIAATDQAQMYTHVQTSTNQNLYVNGVYRATLATLGSTCPITRIGNYGPSVGFPARGTYGHFGTWNRELSQGEISQLFDPLTRWDLYKQKPLALFIDLGGGSPVTGIPRISLTGAGIR